MNPLFERAYERLRPDLAERLVSVAVEAEVLMCLGADSTMRCARLRDLEDEARAIIAEASVDLQGLELARLRPTTPARNVAQEILFSAGLGLALAGLCLGGFCLPLAIVMVV